MVPRATSTDVEPTHHLTLEDQETPSNLYGFVLVNSRGEPDPRAITRNPIPRTSIKTSSGETEYSDLEPPYTAIQQKDWTSGRGQEDFERNRSAFYDSYRMITWREGEAMLAPQEQWTTGYKEIVHNMPGSVSFAQVSDWAAGVQQRRYYATSFVASATISFTRVLLWLKNLATPVANATLSIVDDSAGEPNLASVKSSQTITGNTARPLSYLKLLSISASLTSGTTYWIVLDGNTTEHTDDQAFRVATDPNASASGLVSVNGTTWSAAQPLYFHISEQPRAWGHRFFEYKSAQYAFTTPRDGTAPKLYLNGYRGVATGTQSATTLVDTTQSWATDELVDGVLYLSGGDSAKGQFAVIASNTSDTITITSTWDINPTTATTEYVVLGLDTWQELTGHGVTKKPTDIALSRDVLYVAQGDGTNIRRLRAQNNAGTWEDLGTTAATRSDDGTNEADFLTVYRHSTDGMQVGRVQNNDANGDVSFSRAGVRAWGTNLTFGTAIPVGDRSELATALGLYGDPSFPVIGKEGSVWFIIDDEPQSIPLSEMRAVSNPNNGRALLHHTVYLYFSLLHSVERYFRNNVDDVGPSRRAGLPNLPLIRQGPISKMVGYPGFFFAVISNQGVNDNISSILVNNGSDNWHEIFRAREDIGDGNIHDIALQVVPGPTNDRLWIAYGDEIVYLPMPSNTTDPSRDSNMLFAHDGEIVTSWFHLSLKDVQKFWDSVELFAEAGAGSETFAYVMYQTDDDKDTTNWSFPALEFDTTPSEEVSLTTDDSLTGKRLRLRIVLRTGDNTKTPKLLATVVQAVARLAVKFSYTFTFRAGDENIDIEGDPDNYERVETLISQLDDWGNGDVEARPLTMRTVYSPYDNKKVFVDPASLRPHSIITDDQIEMHVGSVTLVEK